MAALSEKENLLLVYKGEEPEWVPIAERCEDVAFGPAALIGGFGVERKAGDRYTDLFGITYEVSDPRIGPMPAPDLPPVITDITKWREQFPPEKWPSLDGIDWIATAAADTAHWDRENKYSKAMFGGTGAGSNFVFAATVLGHQGAMTAMLEEPEHFDDLMQEITNLQLKVVHIFGKYYKPLSITMCDDCAYNQGTFMSPATYRDRIKPFHKQLVDAIIAEGCTPEIHCCGKAQGIVDDFVDIGLRAWDPAQYFNDLEAIKARHGNGLIIHGAWDSNGAAALLGASEDVVRGAVRSSIDRCAPGGGYVFTTSGMTEQWYVGEEHMGWIYDEADKYGKAFYKKAQAI